MREFGVGKDKMRKNDYCWTHQILYVHVMELFYLCYVQSTYEWNLIEYPATHVLPSSSSSRRRDLERIRLPVLESAAMSTAGRFSAVLRRTFAEATAGAAARRANDTFIVVRYYIGWIERIDRELLLMMNANGYMRGGPQALEEVLWFAPVASSTKLAERI